MALVVAIALLIGVGAAVAVIAGSGDDDSGGEEQNATEITSEDVPASPSEAQIAEPEELPPARETNLARAAETAGCDLRHPRDEGNEHVAGPVRYDSNPPTSGDHFEVPADDGVYPEPPPTEALVHSLEHGRVILQFRPDASEGVKALLQGVYDESPEHVILTPNATDMPYEAAATAWTHLLGCPEANPAAVDALRAFRERYRDKGPEFVP